MSRNRPIRHQKPSSSTDSATHTFPSTIWALVHQAGHSRETIATPALDELIRLYEPALMKHLLHAWRFNRTDAEDFLQGFYTEKVIQQRLIASADERKGRFRAFLKTVLDNYIRTEFRRRSAQKRLPDRAILDDELLNADLSSINGVAPDVFDVEWARVLLQETINNMRQDCEAKNEKDVWEIFNSRLLTGIISEGQIESYASLVTRLGYSSPSSISYSLNKAIRRYRHHLKIALAKYTRDRTELDEEITDLRRILSRKNEK